MGGPYLGCRVVARMVARRHPWMLRAWLRAFFQSARNPDPYVLVPITTHRAPASVGNKGLLISSAHFAHFVLAISLASAKWTKLPTLVPAKTYMGDSRPKYGPTNAWKWWNINFFCVCDSSGPNKQINNPEFKRQKLSNRYNNISYAWRRPADLWAGCKYPYKRINNGLECARSGSNCAKTEFGRKWDSISHHPWSSCLPFYCASDRRRFDSASPYCTWYLLQIMVHRL